MVYLRDAYGSEDLGFSQPVHCSRCVLYDLARIEAPTRDEECPQLRLRQRNGEILDARVTAQTATGLVRLTFPARSDLDGLYDLTLEEYWWV